MRKTFLTFLAATFALLAVSSCGKLEDSISQLDQELKDLAARVDKLEKELNEKIEALKGTVAELDAAYKAADAALKTELEAKITATDGKFVEQLSSLKSELEEKIGKNASQEDLEALVKELSAKYEELKGVDAELLAALTKVGVESVKKSDNGVVITFGDGSTIELPANPEEGLVTVVEVDGVKYWAVIVNGEPVVLEDAVFHPDTDLMFQVDENNQLQYSLDGGKTWINTWAYVAADSAQLVTASYEVAENYVTLIIGGVEYTLPKFSNEESILLSGLTYFAESENKIIELKNAKSAFVVSTPEGWSAEITTDPLALSVTAPAKGMGDTEGKIEVWILSPDGRVNNAYLPVTIGDTIIDITFDKETNIVSLKFAPVEGETPEVYFGACPADEFNADLFIEELVYNNTNCDPGNPDNVSLRKTEIEVPLSELVSGALDAGKQYVVYAAVANWEQDWDSWPPQSVITTSTDDIVKLYCNIDPVEFKSSKASIAEVELEFNLLTPTAEGYYGIFMSEESYYQISMMLEYGMFQLSMILDGGMNMEGIPCNFYTDLTYNGKLSQFGYSEDYLNEGFVNTIQPGGVYYIGIIPVYEGQTSESFKWEDINFLSFTTATPTLDGGIELPEYSITEDYTQSVLHIGKSEDIVYAYYRKFPYEEDAEGKVVYPTSSNWLEDIYYVPDAFDFMPYDGAGFDIEVANDYGKLPGTKYTVALMLIDEDAKAKVHFIVVGTKEIERNTSISVEVTAAGYDINTGKADAEFTVTGTAAELYYTCNTVSSYLEYPGATSTVEILKGTSTWEKVELSAETLVEGKLYADIAIDRGFSDKTYYMHAILVDADGKVSEIATSAGFTVPKK